VDIGLGTTAIIQSSTNHERRTHAVRHDPFVCHRLASYERGNNSAGLPVPMPAERCVATHACTRPVALWRTRSDHPFASAQ